jgi:hypothetical protein
MHQNQQQNRHHAHIDIFFGYKANHENLLLGTSFSLVQNVKIKI